MAWSRIGSAVASARRRLDWRGADPRLGPVAERGAIARTLAYLFGSGSLLLLLTLALPGAAARDSVAEALIAVAALGFAALLIIWYERLPIWFLALSPAFGSILIGLIICFAGPEASAAYALFFAWVVIAAANYLSRTATALHGVFAVFVYAVAIQIAGPGPAPAGLRLAMLAGTAAVAAVVMAGLAARVRGLVSRLEDDARTDPLTGLDNRRALRAEFERELARCKRTGRPLTLVVLDLDWFKRFNDALGHLAGDDALRRVAKVLEEITRSIEIAARLGGEEFAVIAPATDAAGGLALAERLRIAIKSEFADSDPPLTVSVGIAVSRPGRNTAADLFAAADRALYAAKAAGRNRVVGADDDRRPLELARPHG